MDLGNLDVCVRAKFEGCAAKTVKGVGFLRAPVFQKKNYCQISHYGCQFHGTDLANKTRNDLGCYIISLIKFDEVF